MRNVVLLCLDTVRKDYFDRYAPRLLKLADMEFDAWRAASCATVPSHKSMLTGQFPTAHSEPYFHGIGLEESFLSEFTNYRTIAVSANEYLNPEFGFGTLFDEYVPVAPQRRFPDGIDVREYDTEDEIRFREYSRFILDSLRHDKPIRSLGNGITAQTYNLLRKSPLPTVLDDGASAVASQVRNISHSSEPFFLYVNVMDAHEPLHDYVGYRDEIASPPRGWTSSTYDMSTLRRGRGNAERATDHESFLEIYRKVYAAAIDYLDRRLQELIEDIYRASDLETTVIITADHGEELGSQADNYNFGHWNSLSESLINVPFLLVNPPENISPDKTALHSHQNLGEVLTSLAENEWTDVSKEVVGAEFLSDIGADEVPESETHITRRVLRCAIRDGEKIVWSFSEESTIPTQVSPQDDKKEIQIESWAKSIFNRSIAEIGNERLGKSDPKEDMSDIAKQRLEELGYL